VTGPGPTLRELMVGVEGLALLRSLYADAADARAARLAETRELLAGSGTDRVGVELDLPEGYARWLRGDIGHDGETREELSERVVGAVERIAAAHPGDTILAVTHGGAIRALRRYADGDPGDPIENCGTSSLELVDGVLRVQAV